MRQIALALALLAAAQLAAATRNFTHHKYHRRVSVYIPICTFDNDVINDDDLFRKQVRAAEYVFTGKIVSEVEHDDAGKAVYFMVAVKRNIKGEIVGKVRLKLRLYDGEGVKCKLVVRYRYTAIFLAQKIDEYELTLRPVPFSLRNLERTNAAVTGNC